MEALKQFELDEYADHYPDELSGGCVKNFLRTYLCEKPIMLLDEPFGKLDAFTKMKYIARLFKLLAPRSKQSLWLHTT